MAGRERYDYAIPRGALRKAKQAVKRRRSGRPVPHIEPDPGRQEYLRIKDLAAIFLKPVLDLWLDWHIQTGNRLRMAHWRTKQRYTKDCQKAFEAAMLAKGYLPRRRCPKYFAVVQITTQRPRAIEDFANLVWGAKPLEDCLTWRHIDGWGYIADDSELWSYIHYQQVSRVKTKGLIPGTRVQVWRLGRRR